MALLDSRPMEADDDDVAALRIFAARAAAELERRRQAAALEESRVRAIEAADAERRRIGRDLHDGAQQRLMAVANFLTVARKKTGDPMLDLAAEELAAANSELRELARGLFPVALAERGLRGALETLTAGCAVPVEVEMADVRASGAGRARGVLRHLRVADERHPLLARRSAHRCASPIEDDALRIEVARRRHRRRGPARRDGAAGPGRPDADRRRQPRCHQPGGRGHARHRAHPAR